MNELEKGDNRELASYLVQYRLNITPTYGVDKDKRLTKAAETLRQICNQCNVPLDDENEVITAVLPGPYNVAEFKEEQWNEELRLAPLRLLRVNIPSTDMNVLDLRYITQVLALAMPDPLKHATCGTKVTDGFKCDISLSCPALIAGDIFKDLLPILYVRSQLYPSDSAGVMTVIEDLQMKAVEYGIYHPANLNELTHNFTEQAVLFKQSLDALLLPPS